MFPRDLVDENQWMQEAKFYMKQQRERGGSNVTACILNKQSECRYQVTRVTHYYNQISHQNNIFLLFQSVLILEEFQGTVPQNQRLYRADSQVLFWFDTSIIMPFKITYNAFQN